MKLPPVSRLLAPIPTRLPAMVGCGMLALAIGWGGSGLVGQETATAGKAANPFVVNDRAVRGRFEDQLNKIRESEAAVEGSSVVVELEAIAKAKAKAVLPNLKVTRKGEGQVLPSSEVYETAIQSTLVVGNLYLCGKCTKWHSSLAGGVWIDPSGILVTNYHVIESDKAGIFGVMTRSGEVYQVTEVLASSESDDLAVLKVDADREFPAIPLAENDAPVGSEVRVISHPDGRFYTFSEGIAARHYFDPKEKSSRLQITADYARGSSGSGVFDETGALVGIVSSTNSIYYRENDNVQENLQMVIKSCIPVRSLHSLIDQAGAE